MDGPALSLMLAVVLMVRAAAQHGVEQQQRMARPASSPTFSAGEAAKLLGLEWRMEAIAHVASLVVREQQCKTEPASCNLREASSAAMLELQRWAQQDEAWDRLLSSASLYEIARHAYQQGQYGEAIIALEEALALKLYAYAATTASGSVADAPEGGEQAAGGGVRGGSASGGVGGGSRGSGRGGGNSRGGGGSETGGGFVGPAPPPAITALERWQQGLVLPSSSLFRRQKLDVANLLVMRADCLVQMAKEQQDVDDLTEAMELLQLGAALLEAAGELLPDSVVVLRARAQHVGQVAAHLLPKLQPGRVREVLEAYGLECGACSQHYELLQRLVPLLRLPVRVLAGAGVAAGSGGGACASGGGGDGGGGGSRDARVEALEDPFASHVAVLLRKPGEGTGGYAQRLFFRLLSMVPADYLSELGVACRKADPLGRCVSYLPAWVTLPVMPPAGSAARARDAAGRSPRAPGEPPAAPVEARGGGAAGPQPAPVYGPLAPSGRPRPLQCGFLHIRTLPPGASLPPDGVLTLTQQRALARATADAIAAAAAPSTPVGDPAEAAASMYYYYYSDMPALVDRMVATPDPPESSFLLEQLDLLTRMRGGGGKERAAPPSSRAAAAAPSGGTLSFEGQAAPGCSVVVPNWGSCALAPLRPPHRRVPLSPLPEALQPPPARGSYVPRRRRRLGGAAAAASDGASHGGARLVGSGGGAAAAPMAEPLTGDVALEAALRAASSGMGAAPASTGTAHAATGSSSAGGLPHIGLLHTHARGGSGGSSAGAAPWRPPAVHLWAAASSDRDSGQRRAQRHGQLPLTAHVPALLLDWRYYSLCGLLGCAVASVWLYRSGRRQRTCAAACAGSGAGVAVGSGPAGFVFGALMGSYGSGGSGGAAGGGGGSQARRAAAAALRGAMAGGNVAKLDVAVAEAEALELDAALLLRARQMLAQRRKKERERAAAQAARARATRKDERRRAKQAMERAARAGGAAAAGGTGSAGTSVCSALADAPGCEADGAGDGAPPKQAAAGRVGGLLGRMLGLVLCGAGSPVKEMDDAPSGSDAGDAKGSGLPHTGSSSSLQDSTRSCTPASASHPSLLGDDVAAPSDVGRGLGDVGCSGGDQRSDPATAPPWHAEADARLAAQLQAQGAGGGFGGSGGGDSSGWQEQAPSRRKLKAQQQQQQHVVPPSVPSKRGGRSSGAGGSGSAKALRASASSAGAVLPLAVPAVRRPGSPAVSPLQPQPALRAGLAARPAPAQRAAGAAGTAAALPRPAAVAGALPAMPAANLARSGGGGGGAPAAAPAPRPLSPSVPASPLPSTAARPHPSQPRPQPPPLQEPSTLAAAGASAASWLGWFGPPKRADQPCPVGDGGGSGLHHAPVPNPARSEAVSSSGGGDASGAAGPAMGGIAPTTPRSTPTRIASQQLQQQQTPSPTTLARAQRGGGGGGCRLGLNPAAPPFTPAPASPALLPQCAHGAAAAAAAAPQHHPAAMSPGLHHMQPHQLHPPFHPGSMAPLPAPYTLPPSLLTDPSDPFAPSLHAGGAFGGLGGAAAPPMPHFPQQHPHPAHGRLFGGDAGQSLPELPLDLLLLGGAGASRLLPGHTHGFHGLGGGGSTLEPSALSQMRYGGSGGASLAHPPPPAHAGGQYGGVFSSGGGVWGLPPASEPPLQPPPPPAVVVSLWMDGAAAHHPATQPPPPTSGPFACGFGGAGAPAPAASPLHGAARLPSATPSPLLRPLDSPSSHAHLMLPDAIFDEIFHEIYDEVDAVVLTGPALQPGGAADDALALSSSAGSLAEVQMRCLAQRMLEQVVD